MNNLEWKQGTGYTGFASEVGECWTLVDNDEWPTLRVQGALTHTRSGLGKPLLWRWVPYYPVNKHTHIIGLVPDYTAEEAQAVAKTIHLFHHTTIRRQA